MPDCNKVRHWNWNTGASSHLPVESFRSAMTSWCSAAVSSPTSSTCTATSEASSRACVSSGPCRAARSTRWSRQLASCSTSNPSSRTRREPRTAATTQGPLTGTWTKFQSTHSISNSSFPGWKIVGFRHQWQEELTRPVLSFSENESEKNALETYSIARRSFSAAVLTSIRTHTETTTRKGEAEPKTGNDGNNNSVQGRDIDNKNCCLPSPATNTGDTDTAEADCSESFNQVHSNAAADDAVIDSIDMWYNDQITAFTEIATCETPTTPIRKRQRKRSNRLFLLGWSISLSFCEKLLQVIHRTVIFSYQSSQGLSVSLLKIPSGNIVADWQLSGACFLECFPKDVLQILTVLKSEAKRNKTCSASAFSRL